ncbi:MAG TPA: polyphosphate polymerase domain-containing protein [Lacipirellulaceae bacterium]|nr:polyphosphate polymerase domain-containing protein [Lacipirellulaceae bacterium]
MGAAEIYRYERKFVVPEHAADSIRHFVESYLPLDEHMAPGEPFGYRVCSLYLDTPGYALYRQSIDGIKNRYKLRIRFYSNSPDSPAFLEIKQRKTETVHKLRAVVSKRAAERVLRGEWISPKELLSPSDTSARALAEFCECRDRLHAVGTAFISYRREAYVSRSAESVRVTFDRQIAGHPYHPDMGLTVPLDEAFVVVDGAVLELKYNGRAPRWMHDLITHFGLQRRSFPKYVFGVDALGIRPKMAPAIAGGVRC